MPLYGEWRSDHLKSSRQLWSAPIANHKLSLEAMFVQYVRRCSAIHVQRWMSVTPAAFIHDGKVAPPLRCSPVKVGKEMPLHEKFLADFLLSFSLPMTALIERCHALSLSASFYASAPLFYPSLSLMVFTSDPSPL
ncbi:hypothetical protein Tco_1213533 [Tanacetum coccineum]